MGYGNVYADPRAASLIALLIHMHNHRPTVVALDCPTGFNQLEKRECLRALQWVLAGIVYGLHRVDVHLVDVCPPGRPQVASGSLQGGVTITYNP